MNPKSTVESVVGIKKAEKRCAACETDVVLMSSAVLERNLEKSPQIGRDTTSAVYFLLVTSVQHVESIN